MEYRRAYIAAVGWALGRYYAWINGLFIPLSI